MEVFHDIESVKIWRRQHWSKTVGFVPTMGALHEGHISLVKQALIDSDVVIASIFVNQLQFNNPEDFAKYPSTIDADLALLELNGCHAVFIPSSSIMYPTGGSRVGISFGQLENLWEGAMRPGHFNGVGVVVSKLFHIINPDKAFFGQKDLQQLLIIKALVRDLNFSIQIVPCAIKREESGLALSSRNVRLNPESKTIASQLFPSLSIVANSLAMNISVKDSLNAGHEHLFKYPEIQLEYLAVCSLLDLEPLSTFDSASGASIIIAAIVQGVRLIDNIIVPPQA